MLAANPFRHNMLMSVKKRKKTDNKSCDDKIDEVKRLIGRRIKKIRKTQKITQETLAEKIEIEPTHLSGIEVGRYAPSLKTLVRLSVELGVDIDYLFVEHDIFLKVKRLGDKDVKKLGKLIDVVFDG